MHARHPVFGDSDPIDHHRRMWSTSCNDCLLNLCDVVPVIRTDLLPDDVLLDIFDFHASIDMGSRYYDKKKTQAWQSLVHVCRRWRSLVFGSPRRLDLKLYCSPKTRAKGGLDVWPALPLTIEGNQGSSSTNTIAALERLCT